MSFDRLAPHYRWMEFVLAGGKLQRCRTAFLSQMTQARQVLILGEGNGRFLTECAQRLRFAQITCVDASDRMLELARARLRSRRLPEGTVEFVHADALKWAAPARRFDLVVTHFFLDCFPAAVLRQLLEKIAGLASPEAYWLLADFTIPDRGPACWRATIIHWMMYSFFAVATRLPARRLTPPDASLRAQGFVLRERLLLDWGLLHSDLWQRRSELIGQVCPAGPQ